MAWRRAIWDQDGWRADAACSDVDPAIFFAVGTSAEAVAKTDIARSICSECPVAQECLIFAVTTNQEYGVWGGLDEEERKEVRRQWRRASRKASDRTAVSSS